MNGSKWLFNIIMVNEFKLAVVHFARPNPMQTYACAWINRWPKNGGKSEPGRRAIMGRGPPGRRAVEGRGPRAAGPQGRQAAGPSRAVDRGPLGLGPLGRGPVFSKTPSSVGKTVTCLSICKNKAHCGIWARYSRSRGSCSNNWATIIANSFFSRGPVEDTW